ncbi:Gag-Pol fusion protein [Plakobranchus ocellatus]|uniref:Gag-Pol fusion protein n=1 Tax=Plakobranchus ocellatus TaxID=259542 RepID=A0AAV4E392_9GAST|nr:Gag-Pol fusion protein [Plakobranchus ocellatus]
MLYKVIKDLKEPEEIVSGVHAGFDGKEESKAFGGHLSFKKNGGKIFSRVWWPSICKGFRKYKYIQAFDRCQARVPRLQKGSEELHPVEIPPYSSSIIGVDICATPTSKEGYSCMVVAVNYLSKLTGAELEALRRKTAIGVANFLYNCICRHGCIDYQINDRGRDFVNSILSSGLHRLTGVKQIVTIPYHSQVNGQVGQSNRTT